ncbi:hypothetical protein MICA_149 [Micavibrio aeruginosavorus ARL-13]|uniref:Uncharacterized protein n=1 Tax=Micavibrio aeruginosavorus (strain ARL-13) TaxID=856793 RepID=G2KNY8_MICAA|nr:hypothetical protein MICA_149 [Micavibrio aeruginosavorus ARL-13]
MPSPYRHPPPFPSENAPRPYRCNTPAHWRCCPRSNHPPHRTGKSRPQTRSWKNPRKRGRENPSDIKQHHRPWTETQPRAISRPHNMRPYPRYAYAINPNGTRTRHRPDLFKLFN